jgi:hypothetical protein
MSSSWLYVMNQKIKWYLISRTIHGHYLLFFGSVIKFFVLLINFWSFWFGFMVLNAEFESQSGWGVQHYVIKFVSDLRQVSGFLRVLLVSSINKTDCHDITEILLKVAFKTIKPNQNDQKFINKTKNLITEPKNRR